ncbi:hypothetical protein ACVCAH_11480 [Micromonospora sp. LZ34]
MLDLSRTPADVKRDAAAVLRQLLQLPKLPPILTDLEEEPDDH